MTGSPTAIGLIATLWPEGIRSTVVTPSATNLPGGKLARAISTPSSGCRRMTGLMVMGVSYIATIVPRTLRSAKAMRSVQGQFVVSLASDWIPALRSGTARRTASGTQRAHALPDESLRVALTCILA
ncbi:hypothetical protein ACVWWG_005759 [Bradyrhizobium sp. LB7.2]